MKLKDLTNVLNEEYSITLKDYTGYDDVTANSDYPDITYIEDDKQEKEVVLIDFWFNPRHNNEKAYYIEIK